jgi:hypothetical protein
MLAALVFSFLLPTQVAHNQTVYASEAPVPQYDWDLDGRITTADLTAFDACLAGAPLPSPAHSIDINGNSVYPEDADRTTLLSVVTGGPDDTGFIPPLCPSCPVLLAPVPDPVPPSFTLDLAPLLARLPQETHLGVNGTPGIIHLPWRSTPYTVTAPILDMGGTPGRPLILAGLHGPDGERPRITLNGRSPVGIHLSGSVSDIVIDSLHLIGTPSHSALIRAYGPAHNLLIQDCILEGGAIGLAVEGLTMPGAGTVRLHRTIILRQASSFQHNQGVYVSACQFFSATDCVLYDVGLPTTFNQGFYFVAGAGTRNLSTTFVHNPGFAGVQCRGGTYTITSNIFSSCGNAIGIGHPMSYGTHTSGTFSHNLILFPKRPGWGIALQNSSATVSFNTLISTPGFGYALQIENPNPLPTTVSRTLISGFELPINWKSPASLSPALLIEEPIRHDVTPPTIPWPLLISRPARHFTPSHSTLTYLPTSPDR